MTSVRFLPAARVDLLVAIAWYDEQEPGLGRRFNGEVEHAVASVLAHPRGEYF